MLIDLRLSNVASEAAASARQAEEFGADGVWTGETNHDPFLPMTIAAEHSRRLELGTSALVAFARSPMVTAQLSHDLNVLAGGRFRLGLGPQVAAHIVQRFAMPYSRPVARMREYVAALRAIWACWDDGAKLDFRGDFYQHTLMTPTFSPPANPTGPTPIWLAAVGPKMTELAGEVADGLLAHLFTTPRYLRQVTLPALRRGAARAGRDVATVQVQLPLFVVTAATAPSFAATREFVARQIAFYASTPAYLPVLEAHSLEALHWELFELSVAGEWDQMTALIDDEVLSTFAVVGEPDTIAAAIVARVGRLASRIALSPPRVSDADWHSVVTEVRRLTNDTAAAPA